MIKHEIADQLLAWSTDMNDFARKQVQTGDLPDDTYLDMAL